MGSILTDKSLPPNDQILAGELGPSYKTWTALKASITREHGETREEWKHYGARSGWVLKLLLKKRNLFFMIPGVKLFTLGFLFGDRAVTAICHSSLPPAMIREVKEARRYAEGRGLRIEVRNRAALRHVLELVNIKVNS
jgi:hypothetical protein